MKICGVIFNQLIIHFMISDEMTHNSYGNQMEFICKMVSLFKILTTICGLIYLFSLLN